LLAGELNHSTEWEQQQVQLFRKLAEGYLGGVGQ
jgi:hypothetical protein